MMATKPKLATVEGELKAMDGENANLRIWNAVCTTDPSHTKAVEFGRKFTAIDAHYQIQEATRLFGPVGEGWGYDTGEMVFADGLVIVPVTLWHGDRTKTFGPIYGSTTLRDRKGNIDKDAPKKATTDALTKGLSQLGFNADVFLGRFDDNKYVEDLKKEFSGANDQDSSSGPTPRVKLEGQWTSKTALKGGVHAILNGIRKCKAEEEIDEILKKPANKDTIKQAERDWPELITGDPRIEGDLGLKGYVTRKREELRGSLPYQLLVSTLQECESMTDLKRWMSEHGDTVGTLDDYESRKFEELYDTQERTLKALEQENA
jgi:hypothetical protein